MSLLVYAEVGILMFRSGSACGNTMSNPFLTSLFPLSVLNCILKAARAVSTFSPRLFSLNRYTVSFRRRIDLLYKLLLSEILLLDRPWRAVLQGRFRKSFQVQSHTNVAATAFNSRTLDGRRAHYFRRHLDTGLLS